MVNISNQRFGRLIAIEPLGSDKHHSIIWKCKCDCGNIVNVDGRSLRRGMTRSCGCLAHDVHLSGDIRRKHGGCGTRLYATWKRIKNRCNNPNSPDYQKWYGKFGITVCEEWSNSFEKFRDWSLSHGYRDDLTIDRIDYTKGYSPDNCRWVTAKEQANNKRNVSKIEYNGESHTISEWADITGLSRSILYNRICVYKWDIERALTTLPKGRGTSFETKTDLDQLFV